MGRFFMTMAAFVLGFCSCSPVVLNRQWKAQPGAGASLAVVMPESEINVTYSGNVDKEFGTGDVRTRIRENIRFLVHNSIVENTQFKEVRFDAFGNTVTTASVPIALGSQTYNRACPRENSDVVMEKGAADFVLVVDSVHVGSEVGMSVNSTVDPSGEASHPHLPKPICLSSRFTLWDVHQKCPVAYGYTHRYRESYYFTDRADWLDLTDHMVRTIFAKPGFLLKRDTVVYDVNLYKKIRFPGRKNKFAYNPANVKWLVAHTITVNRPESPHGSKTGNGADSKRTALTIRNLKCMDFRQAGAVIDTQSLFTEKFTTRLHDRLLEKMPSPSARYQECQAALDRQLAGHFAKFDYAIDSLDAEPLSLVRQDSTEFLCVFYAKFRQPRPDETIDRPQDIDLNFYCTVIDCRNNCSIARYDTDLNDLVDLSKTVAYDSAIDMFGRLGLLCVSAVIR